MDQPLKKSDLDFDYDSYGLERRLDDERAPDAAGYWFLAAVLFAFIAAGSHRLPRRQYGDADGCELFE